MGEGSGREEGEQNQVLGGRQERIPEAQENEYKYKAVWGGEWPAG